MTYQALSASRDKSQLSLERPSFDAGSKALGEWLLALRSSGVRHASPALLLALEDLRRAEISPVRRIAMLRLLKAPVLKACAGLPKPWSSSAQPHGNRGVTLEQRLFRLMFQNLNQALHQLDRRYFLLDAVQAGRRNWTIRNLFRFFQRELRYATLWGTRLPPNTWRDLHDLFIYLAARRTPQTEGAAAEALDPDQEYKQLLLFGLAAQVSPAGARGGVLVDGLARWARETRLEDPHGVDGGGELFVVEISEDGPPRRHRGHLNTGFRGWVIALPALFVQELDRAARERQGPVGDQGDHGRPKVAALG